jgi:hypothetical protein
MTTTGNSIPSHYFSFFRGADGLWSFSWIRGTSWKTWRASSRFLRWCLLWLRVFLTSKFETTPVHSKGAPCNYTDQWLVQSLYAWVSEWVCLFVCACEYTWVCSCRVRQISSNKERIDSQNKFRVVEPKGDGASVTQKRQAAPLADTVRDRKASSTPVTSDTTTEKGAADKNKATTNRNLVPGEGNDEVRTVTL